MSSVNRKLTRRIAYDAAFLILALGLSYLEALFPLGAIIPIPGFKLGLANVVVMLVLWRISVADAAIVSLLRVTVMGMLFGTPMSFLFSFCGALLSFAVLVLLRKTASGRISFIGVSVLSASAHNMGQLLCAGIFFGFGVVSSYLPFLLVASTVFGALSGAVINAIYPPLEKIRTEEKSV